MATNGRIIYFICLISSFLIIAVNAGKDDAIWLNPSLVPLAGIIAGIRKSKDSRPCVLPYVDFPEKEPVFLTVNDELIKPEGRALTFQPGEAVHLACPGNGNNLQASGLSVTPAICVRDKILHVAGAERDLSSLNCIKSVTGDVQEWNLMKCAGGRGRHIGIGHRIAENNFVSLIVGCYDRSVGAALYTEHTIYGSAIDHGKASPRRPSFKQGDATIGIDPEAYTQRRQKQTFENYFGKNQQYIGTGSFLAKGHLAPDADFVFMTSRWATYFYVNVVPQWHRDINNRNWKTLEMTIRKFAAKEGKEFRVVTGSHDILVLGGKQIYLNNGKLPAPALTWKVIQNKETRHAIGFITLNNAFDPTDVTKCCLCPDIAEDYGWKNDDYKDYTRGLTYACDVDEMRKFLPNVPNLHQTNILVGPVSRSFWTSFFGRDNKYQRTELRMRRNIGA